MKKRVAVLKYSFILLLELLTQITLAPIIGIPIVFLLGTEYNNYYFFVYNGMIVVGMLVAIPLKLGSIKVIEGFFPKVYYPKKPLKIYYWLNGVLSIFVNYFAFFWGGMMASGGVYYYFLVGFLYIWWIPNVLTWLVYVIGSVGVEKKEENKRE